MSPSMVVGGGTKGNFLSGYHVSKAADGSYYNIINANVCVDIFGSITPFGHVCFTNLDETYNIHSS